MHHLHPIFKNVSGVFQGPHLQEGYPLPHPSLSGAKICLPPPPPPSPAVDPLDPPMLEVRM